MEFHQRLRQLRKEKKMTQSALAKELAYGSTAISNYESGHNQPSIADLKKIASIFSVSMDYLLCVSDTRDASDLEKKIQQYGDFAYYFEPLTPEHKDDLLFYMQFLLNRQILEQTPAPEPAPDSGYEETSPRPRTSLKVAQKKAGYK